MRRTIAMIRLVFRRIFLSFMPFLVRSIQGAVSNGFGRIPSVGRSTRVQSFECGDALDRRVVLFGCRS